ncbi:MAG: Ig-like domain-containing protein [Aquabacterium sp.]|nr:Ig-like domain-containing protein [Aquabacterium sp.]
MTWDPVRAEIVLFGGNGPNLYDNDIWSYKTETGAWTLLDPHTHCPGNEGYSKPNGTDDTNFKYDPVNNLYWAFGAASGYRCIGLGPSRIAAPGSGPTTIVDPSLSADVDDHYTEWFVNSTDGTAKVVDYDAGTRTLSLATPLASLTAGSTYRLYATSGAGFWYFDPTTQVWVGQNTPPGNTGPIPTQARIAPAVDYSVVDEAFALWGGLSMGSDRSVWKLDVRTKKWTQLPVPAGGAPAHRRELLNSFVYDKVNDVFILFGGVCSYAFDTACPEGTVSGQTWAYRLATNTWVNMNPSTAPTPRAQHLMVYDDEHGIIVLFGGGAGGSETNDTWVYHYASNTWTPLAPASAPPPRRLGQVAYNPVTRQTIIFGGATTGVGQRSDIWALKLTSGAPPNTPPSVSLTSPAPGSTYTAPATIALAASASDTDGSVAKVEFYAGATKIGEDTTAPYAVNWSSVPAGSYSLTAVATDNAGATATSTAVNVTVNPGGGTSTNVAAQANGGVASASSTYSSAYPVAAVNDGSRLGNRWAQGGGWNDATASTYPDWVQVTFAGARTIDRIDVFTLQDNYAAGIAPTPSSTFNLYGITDFTVQYWTGAAWATVPDGSVSANNLVWRSFTFPAVSTDRLRITVSKALYWYSRIVEIEAWSTP